MKTSYFGMMLAACALLSRTAQAQLTVSDLRVEHMHAPSVVDVHTPRFSWINLPRKHSLKGQRQNPSCFHLIVFLIALLSSWDTRISKGLKSGIPASMSCISSVMLPEKTYLSMYKHLSNNIVYLSLITIIFKVKFTQHILLQKQI